MCHRYSQLTEPVRVRCSHRPPPALSLRVLPGFLAINLSMSSLLKRFDMVLILTPNVTPALTPGAGSAGGTAIMATPGGSDKGSYAHFARFIVSILIASFIVVSLLE